MRQLSFFQLPDPCEHSHPSRQPRPTAGATIRLSNLRPGASCLITYATSSHNGASSFYSVYEARLTNNNGQPLIRIGQHLASYTPADIAGQPPTTAADYHQLFSYLARQHSTAARPALED